MVTSNQKNIKITDDDPNEDATCLTDTPHSYVHHSFNHSSILIIPPGLMSLHGCEKENILCNTISSTTWKRNQE